MKQPKIVLLIFVSGKIVLTGAKVRASTLVEQKLVWSKIWLSKVTFSSTLVEQTDGQKLLEPFIWAKICSNKWLHKLAPNLTTKPQNQLQISCLSRKNTNPRKS